MREATPSPAADAAWAAHVAALQSMLPRAEAEKILLGTRAAHFARWRRVESARLRVQGRRLTEQDIESY